MLGDIFSGIILTTIYSAVAFGLPYSVGSLMRTRLAKLKDMDALIKFTLSIISATLALQATNGIVTAMLTAGTLASNSTLLVIGISGLLIGWKSFNFGTSHGYQLVKEQRDISLKKLSDIFSDFHNLVKLQEQQYLKFTSESAKIEGDMQIAFQKFQRDLLELKEGLIRAARNEARMQTLQEINDSRQFMKSAFSGLMVRFDKTDIVIAELRDELKKLKNGEQGTNPTNFSQTANGDTFESSGSSTLSDAQKSSKILSMSSIMQSSYRPLQHKICLAVYTLLKNRQEENYKPILSDIAAVSGVNKGDVKVRLQELANAGLMVMNKGKRRIEFTLSDRLKATFYPVLENQREGGMESAYLLQAAKEHHLMKEHYFESLKQDIAKEQPDAIAIPPLDRDSFNILEAVALEIESPEEIRAHPEQVRTNMLKNLGLFRKVQVWCYEENKGALERLRGELGDVAGRIEVITVQKGGSM